MSFLKSIGHASLGAMFIIGGWGAFSNPGGRVDMVARVGIPRAKEATILNAATMIVAGTTLAAGILPRVSAALLIGSLIPTTYVGHAYWSADAVFEEPGDDRWPARGGARGIVVVQVIS